MLVVVVVGIAERANAASLTTTWLGGSGNWTDAGGWSNGVPNNGTDSYTAAIDGGNPTASQVTLGSSATVDGLLVDAGDQLTVTGAGQLTVVGSTISNAGQIALQGTGSQATTLETGATLRGAGTVLVQDGVIQSDGLVNQDNTISGSGEIEGAAVANYGVIEADVSGKVLNIFSPLHNFGVLRATNGGLLGAGATGGIDNTHGDIQITNGSGVSWGDVVTVDGGTIEITNDSHVLTGVGLYNARVTTDATSSFSLGGAGLAQDVEFDGPGEVDIIGDPYQQLYGTITNRGNLHWQLLEAFATAPVDLKNFGSVTIVNGVQLGSAALTLEGGGTVAIGPSTSGFPPVPVLSGQIANLDNRISGAGNLIGLVQNGGSVMATGGTLAVQSASIAHTGVFGATAGGTLEMAATSVTGTGSWLANGGTIHVTGDVETTGNASVLDGGSLVVDTTMSARNVVVDPTGALDVKGLLEVAGSVAFDGANGGRWLFEPGSILKLTGTAPWQFLEAAGLDEGQVPAGFTSANFALPELEIGADGHLALRDLFDNGNRTNGAEAVYVDKLVFDDGAGQLDLNGLHLYYNTLVGSPGQIINVLAAPEPGADVLVAAGLVGLGLARRSSRRFAQ